MSKTLPEIKDSANDMFEFIYEIEDNADRLAKKLCRLERYIFEEIQKRDKTILILTPGATDAEQVIKQVLSQEKN